jgi:hypothetical protein
VQYQGVALAVRFFLASSGETCGNLTGRLREKPAELSAGGLERSLLLFRVGMIEQRAAIPDEISE